MNAKPMGMLFDATRCGGCYRCVRACQEKNNPGARKDPEEIRDLSATAFTALHEHPDEEVYYRNLCRHCVSPSCVSVCPVTALQKDALGPVVYDATRCIGCRYCMTACPFNVPRYQWDDPVPEVRKCSMCVDRLREGRVPACVEACPNEATIAGPRDELLDDAHERIAEDPDEYHPHVYGEKEVGGTSVLFLSPIPLEQLGYAEELGTAPLPALTWKVLHKIPGVVVTGAAGLLALWWITARRNEVMRAEALAALKSGRLAPDGNGEEVDRD